MSKVKKQRKGLSPQTKRTLGNVFKSIIMNQSCIDGAKESPWWIALIFLLISIVLPVVPITFNYSKTYGASFVASANYGLDRGLANTTQFLSDNGYEFKVDGGEMSFYKDGAQFVPSEDFIASDIINDPVTGSQTYNFLFYVTNYTGGEFSSLLKKIEETKYESGTLDSYSDIKIYDENATFYTPSFIVLNPYTLTVGLFKNNSTTLVATTYGNLTWRTTLEGDILARTLDVDDTLGPVETRDAIFDQWKHIFNETYTEAKYKTMWMTSLIYLGVYAGLVLFLGLLIFLLTRGKNNIYRSLSFFTCERIAWWAAFTPAVLGLIFGFIFANNFLGQMSFIVFVSIRLMWLSMRQLRPM